MFLPEDNHIQTAPKWQTETPQECGWWQSGSKQKHRPFFHANKKKIGLKAVHCWAHFSQGASWGAQRTKKQEDEAVNNLAVRQSHIAGVKTSIPENEAQWSDGRRKWIPEEYQTAAESWAKARQIPTGRSSKTPSLKPCYKAADSWATTAWKHRLVATEAGGRFTNSYTGIPEAPLWDEAAGTSCRPNVTARALWQGPMAPTYCGRKHTSHQPAQDRGTNHATLAEMWVHAPHHLPLSYTKLPGSTVARSTKNHRTVLTVVSSKRKGSW